MPGRPAARSGPILECHARRCTPAVLRSRSCLGAGAAAQHGACFWGCMQEEARLARSRQGAALQACCGPRPAEDREIFTVGGCTGERLPLRVRRAEMGAMQAAAASRGAAGARALGRGLHASLGRAIRRLRALAMRLNSNLRVLCSPHCLASERARVGVCVCVCVRARASMYVCACVRAGTHA